MKPVRGRSASRVPDPPPLADAPDVRIDVPHASIPSEFLIEAEAALFLRLRPQTLANWRSIGIGPAYSKIGGRVLYERSVLVEFVRANQQTATTVAVASAGR